MSQIVINNNSNIDYLHRINLLNNEYFDYFFVNYAFCTENSIQISINFSWIYNNIPFYRWGNFVINGGNFDFSH